MSLCLAARCLAVSCFGVSAAELVAAVVEGVLAAPVARLAGLVAEAAGDAVTGGVAGALVADVPDGLSDASGLFFALAPVVTHGVAAGALLAASGAVTMTGAVQAQSFTSLGDTSVEGTLFVGGSPDTSTNGLPNGGIQGTSGAQSAGTAHTHGPGSYSVTNGMHFHTL